MIITHLKNICFIILFTAVVYWPVKDNHFIGDDHLLIEQNSFYKSLSNIPRLFQPQGYHLKTETILNTSLNTDRGPVSYSYQPVVNLSYFMDYHLWGNLAGGYHITSLWIHLLNGGLLYAILFLLLETPLLCLAITLLFMLHPIQTEAVAVISYRAAILAAFFVLLSWLSWLLWRRSQQIGFYFISVGGYALGLLSKESAIMFLPMIIIYDMIFKTGKINFKKQVAEYAGFAIILIGFLYLYLVVFPNSSLNIHWLGGNALNHVLTMLKLYQDYLVHFLCPWTVHLIPGRYTPPAPALLSLTTLYAVTASLLTICLGFYFIKKNKILFFFLIWFILFYIPVSNLIPIANTVAHRFLYLPSIGILAVLAISLVKASEKFKLLVLHNIRPNIIPLAFICSLSMLTFTLNLSWKNDFVVAKNWVAYYPQASRAYGILGNIYFEQKDYETAVKYFLKVRELNDADPVFQLYLADAYYHLQQYDLAKAEVLAVLKDFPTYTQASLILANIYGAEQEVDKQLSVLLKTQPLLPKSIQIYHAIIRIYRSQGKDQQAQAMLGIAAKHLSKIEFSILEQMIQP